MKKLSARSLLVVCLIALASAVSAQTPSPVVATVAEAKWGPAPPMLPPGAQIAVLAGNPMGTGAYSVRLKFPANYAIPAHSHPTDENVVVTKGDMTFGMGDKLSKTAAGNKKIRVGGYALAPTGMNHYAWAGASGAEIVLYGQGPVEFKYVDPADDPRNAKPAAK
ncbi:MAG TPA: cupin domain-containing protein [Thermoanaerobaculia bacterium]|nr:cupin domain-containing protein [Thermoanaerobaculia bacterium]